MHSQKAIAAGATHHTTFRDYDVSSMRFNRSYREYLRELRKYDIPINFE